MARGCPNAGDEAVGRLDLPERVAHPIDRRLMGLFDAIGMVVHSLKECRERMRAERDAVKQERDAAESAIRYAYAKLTPDLTTTRISEAISALSQALVIINDRKPA